MADPLELSEDVDLAPEWRRYVLDMHAKLAALDHYEVLGVPRDATKKAIKSAYFGLAAKVHPDRHFKKKLGSYKAKMEHIFARLSIAFETLSDAAKRDAYDKTLAPATPQAPAGAPATRPTGSAGAPSAPMVRAAVDPKIAAQRQAAMDALKQRFADGKARAKQQVELGHRARAAGDFLSASEAYRIALLAMPNDAEVKTAFDDVQKAAAEKLVEANRKKAMLEERFGRWAAAAESWEKVAAARPNDAEVSERLAQALARAAREAAS